MTPYDTRSMRELAALRMVWASACGGWDGGRSNVVREEASGGQAALEVCCVYCTVPYPVTLTGSVYVWCPESPLCF